MANTRTLTELLLDIRHQSDTVGLEARHPDSVLTTWLNQSYRVMRTKISNAGFSFFIVDTAELTLPTAPPETDEQYLEVAYPDGALAIHGFDVRVNNTWYPLAQGSFAARRDYQSRSGVTRPGVETFVVRSVPNQSADATGGIMLFPRNTEGHTYRIWFLPEWTDITVGSSELYGHDIWFEWLIWDVCRKVFIKDNDSSGALKAAEDSLSALWPDMVKSAQAMQSAGPEVPRKSTRRRRRGGRRL